MFSYLIYSWIAAACSPAPLPPPPPAAPSPLGLHLTLIGYIHAHVERTATVGLQAKTASAMPVCPPETRTFSYYNLMISSI
jgi:hypothetical protein